jgi:hypothetical protein
MLKNVELMYLEIYTWIILTEHFYIDATIIEALILGISRPTSLPSPFLSEK